MIKVEHYEVMGWEHAIRGMRNPMNSWNKSDSGYCHEDHGCGECGNEACTYVYTDNCGPYMLGKNDLSLMMKLRNAGTDHRKFMRMITVYVDITAPLYWWKEFDTYKVGTVANSCSTMHKIHEKEFTLDDFSHERLEPLAMDTLRNTIGVLNFYRDDYNKSKNAVPQTSYHKHDMNACFHNMIQLLPSSYNQKRTIMFNYEVLANIYKSRKNHKLKEWHDLCDWIKTLPYSELIIGQPDRSETSFQEDLDFFVNDCTKAQLKVLYERVSEKLKEENTNA